MRAVVWTLALLLLVGCDEREPVNPLDPDNPDTGGRPDWLDAIADNEAVDLTWRTPPPDGFARFELLRAPRGGTYTLVDSIMDPSVTAFRDSNLVNGAPLDYRLDLLLDGGSRVMLPSKAVTPGAAVPWILENVPIGLVRATPDARRLRVRTGSFNGYFDVVTNATGDSVWAADYVGDDVEVFDLHGLRARRTAVSLPYRIGVDTSTGVLWVGSWRFGTNPSLIAIDRGDRELARFTLDEEVRDIVVDPITGTCYAAQGRGGGVAVASVGDTLRVLARERSVMMLAIDPGALVFAADPFDWRILSIDVATDSILAEVSTDSSPQAIHFSEGSLWVAQSTGLVELDAATLMETRRLDAVGEVTSLVRDTEADALWATLPIASRVVRISLADDERTVLSLFQPFAIALGLQASTP